MVGELKTVFKCQTKRINGMIYAATIRELLSARKFAKLDGQHLMGNVTSILVKLRAGRMRRPHALVIRVTWSPYTTLEKTTFLSTPSAHQDFGSEVVRRDLSGLGLTQHTGTIRTGIPINQAETVPAQRLIQLIDHRALGTTSPALYIDVLLYVRLMAMV